MHVVYLICYLWLIVGRNDFSVDGNVRHGTVTSYTAVWRHLPYSDVWHCSLTSYAVLWRHMWQSDVKHDTLTSNTAVWRRIRYSDVRQNSLTSHTVLWRHTGQYDVVYGILTSSTAPWRHTMRLRFARIMSNTPTPCFTLESQRTARWRHTRRADVKLPHHPDVGLMSVTVIVPSFVLQLTS